MWYKIDFYRLVLQLLPPLLRSRFLASLLHVLTLPIRSVYVDFRSLKEMVDNRLAITGHVICLEKVLNDAFFLKDGQIYLEGQEYGLESVCYYIAEDVPTLTLHSLTEGIGHPLYYQGEPQVGLNIAIKVPTFLCTSTESQVEDLYGWQHLRTIRNIMNTYKPAGRTYSIELYNYE